MNIQISEADTGQQFESSASIRTNWDTTPQPDLDKGDTIDFWGHSHMILKALDFEGEYSNLSHAG